ncbi:uncharacterized protein LOC111305226 [Durio zibethinus]|uniref:Uncharacterized protein LOC111305226 n=1 Tax=Durio zibethinus TaxID=66656 RepID=A0A6P5ZZY1_DURZI|nr:uncharacterized protein LOC111305226 [Durio zibethinus]
MAPTGWNPSASPSYVPCLYMGRPQTIVSLLRAKRKTLLAVLCLWKTLSFQFIQEQNIPWNTLRRLFFMQVDRQRKGMHAAMLFAAVMFLILGWANTPLVWSFQHSMIHCMLIGESLFLIVTSIRIVVFEFAELLPISRIVILDIFLCINSSFKERKLFS